MVSAAAMTLFDSPKKEVSENILIINVLHNILDPAVQNIAEAVNGVGLYIFVVF